MNRTALRLFTFAALAAPALLFAANATRAQDDPQVNIPDFATDATMPLGEQVYRHWCSHCHNPGIEHPGTQAIAAKYDGQRPGVLLEWTDLEPAYVELFVRQGISVMPQFRKTQISDAELKALAEWMAERGRKP